MVLPPPGGPLISRWWPPAAATSSARLASSCPWTSERSWSLTASSGARGVPAECAAPRTSMPSTWLTTAASDGHGMTSRPSIKAASAASSAGTNTRSYPSSRRPRAATSTPSTCRTEPSRASSPRKALRGGAGRRACASAMATAIGRSRPVPSLRSSAGARLTVKRVFGNCSSLFLIAERTRSRASLTVVVARPTRKNFTSPPRLMSASTWTGRTSRPASTQESTLPSMRPTLLRPRRRISPGC